MKQLSILCFLFLLSCGGKKGYNDNHGYDLRDLTLECPSGTCPSSVSLILIGSDSQCSGTLINKKYVLTNSHCLTNGYYDEGSDCSDVTALFLNNQGRTVKYTCKDIKVLNYLHDDENSKNDYALFELESAPKNIDSVKVSEDYNKPLDRDFVNLYVTNVTSNTTGVIKHHRCLNRHNTIYNITTTDSTAPLMALGQCPVIGGNSGSGILNADNELVGVVFAGADPDKSDSIYNIGSTEVKFPENFGVGIQSNCLELSPHVEGFDMHQCNAQEETQEMKEQYLEDHTSPIKEKNEMIKYDRYRNDQHIRWKISEYSEQDYSDIINKSSETQIEREYLTPICIKSGDELVYKNEYKVPRYGAKSKIVINDSLDPIITDITEYRDRNGHDIQISESILSGFSVHRTQNRSILPRTEKFKNVPLCD